MDVVHLLVVRAELFDLLVVEVFKVVRRLVLSLLSPEDRKRRDAQIVVNRLVPLLELFVL